MHIGGICSRSLGTCDRGASVTSIARQMRDSHLSEVVVVEERAGRRCPVGVVTDRDIVLRVIAGGGDADRMTAGELIVGPLETVLDSEKIYDAIWHMRDKRLHHMVVVDEHEALTGLLRADDLSEFLASELIEVARIRCQQAEFSPMEASRYPAMSARPSA